MSKTLIALILVICTLLAGCFIESLNPLYTNETIVFDSDLIGTWYSAEDDDEEWTFEKANENEYTLIGKFNGGEEKEAKFEAYLVQLGNHLYLDIYPEELDQIPDIYREHLIPVHTFLRFRHDKDFLITESIDYDLFKDLASREESPISFIKLEDRLLLTASTEELQKFFIENERAEIFQSPDTLFHKN